MGRLPVSVARRAEIFHLASTALSRRKYCIEEEEKSGQKQVPRSRRAPAAQRGAPIFYRTHVERILFSPRCLPASFAGRQLVDDKFVEMSPR